MPRKKHIGAEQGRKSREEQERLNLEGGKRRPGPAAQRTWRPMPTAKQSDQGDRPARP
ncbi:MAG: hypothetical protein LC624_03170 [Halobacteriales archaeon]|nr:hypothetical protein [Halobacteriales archaeon]